MSKQGTFSSQNSILYAGSVVNAEPPNEIKVTVHIPANVAESTKQQKINRIYDILKPSAPR